MLKSNINSNYAYLKRGYSSDPKMRIQEDIYVISYFLILIFYIKSTVSLKIFK